MESTPRPSYPGHFGIRLLVIFGFFAALCWFAGHNSLGFDAQQPKNDPTVNCATTFVGLLQTLSLKTAPTSLIELTNVCSPDFLARSDIAAYMRLRSAVRVQYQVRDVRTKLTGSPTNATEPPSSLFAIVKCYTEATTPDGAPIEDLSYGCAFALTLRSSPGSNEYGYRVYDCIQISPTPGRQLVSVRELKSRLEAEYGYQGALSRATRLAYSPRLVPSLR